jgi:predicted  nucleic acid-binding Zn-ribbon protein
MNDQKLTTDFIALERKMKILIDELESAREEIKVLKEENSRQKALLTEKDEQLNRFQNTIKISKIVEVASRKRENTTELKRTINEYIREIDKCIAHLSM